MGIVVDLGKAMLLNDKQPASPLVSSERMRVSLLQAAIPFIARHLEIFDNAERSLDWGSFVIRAGDYENTGRWWINLSPQVIDYVPDDGLFRGPQEVVLEFAVFDDEIVDPEINLHMTVADAEHVEKLVQALRKGVNIAPVERAPGEQVEVEQRAEHRRKILASMRKRLSGTLTDVEASTIDAVLTPDDKGRSETKPSERSETHLQVVVKLRRRLCAELTDVEGLILEAITNDLICRL